MSVNIKENGQLVKTAGLNSQTVIIDNLTTQDATKALSAKQGYVLNQNKVDKVEGKGLSTNDYTNEEKTKLAGILVGAEPNVQSDWKQSDSSSDDFIKNKPTSDIKTSDDGQFSTVTGGLMQKCEVDLEPIQSGSGTPSPSNVRPIRGHTQVQVGNVGKNLLKVTEISKTLNGLTFTINDDGSIKISGTATANTYFYPFGGVIPSYLVGKSVIVNGSTSGVNIRLWHYDGTNSVQSVNGNDSPTVTISTTSGAVDVVIWNGTTVNTTIYPMLRLATETDPTFEPFNGYTTTINLGGTYYGGTLDAVSGEFTVTHELVDLGTLSWTKNTQSSAIDRYYATLTNGKVGQQTVVANIKCSGFEPVSMATLNSGVADAVAIHHISGDAWISTTVGKYSDANAFKSAVNGVQLCYELATPFTIQLDPQTLETLVGQNDVFAPLDGQSVEEVEYREVLAFEDVPKAIPYECVDPIGDVTLFKIHKYGRVVVLKFDDLQYYPVASEDGFVYLGKLPERFYHKYPNPTAAQHMWFGVINDNNGTLQMKQLTIEQYSGNVSIYYLADEMIKPLGSITYILDHD